MRSGIEVGMPLAALRAHAEELEAVAEDFILTDRSYGILERAEGLQADVFNLTAV
jgi:hypothetical protein